MTEQNALEDIVLGIKAAFEKVLTHMEQDTRDLVEMSYTDSLTKLSNRRAFDRYYQTTLLEYMVTGKPMSLIFIDIDHFKDFNDSYGHRIGDQALVTVASKLTGYAQKYGTIPNRSFFPARFGGEEFVVALLGSGLPRRWKTQKICVPSSRTTTSSSATTTGRCCRRESRSPYPSAWPN